MELFVDDAGFVRAPTSLVYRRLTDVGRWPVWWRGAHVTAQQGRDDGEEPWLLDLAAGRLHRIRLAARFHTWRLDTGVAVRLAGDVDGDAEFWLEPAAGGTVVHHLLVGRTRLRASRRTHDAYRRTIRRGLWGLKETLQVEARTMAGLRP